MNCSSEINKQPHVASLLAVLNGSCAGRASYATRLAAQWRREAANFTEYGAAELAKTLLKCASDLEAAEREDALEELTLEEAKSESGFSYSSLQKKVAAGEIPNVGTKGKPRLRRGDLPRKGTPRPSVSIAEAVLASRFVGQ